VLRLGSDVPPKTGRHAPCTLVTVGNLIARKRHADVLRAMWLLGDRWPDLRYVVIGDGPERGTLERLAGELGVAERVQFTGRLPHDEALRTAREGTIFVMPSTDEAFGVAYIEAMAAGLPAIGALGEPGPEEIAAAGDGLRMVPPGDVEALAAEIGAMLDDASGMHALGDAARATVARHFTWEECGKATVRAYEDAL
jgi:glycosyltransferase involved in cell wall biosynthesis